MRYENFEDINEIDEDNLMEYCEDIDDYRFFDTTLIVKINGKEHVLTAKKYDDKIKEMLNPKEGKVIVITDQRGYCFDDFPNDYGDEEGWICEALKKDIETDSVSIEDFEYLGSSLGTIKGSGSCWCYKNDGIDAYISSDMGSMESVTVFVDGDEVMSA